MEHLLLTVFGVAIGAPLGVFCMALFAAADRERFPEPSPDADARREDRVVEGPLATRAGRGGSGGAVDVRPAESTPV